MVGRGGGRLTGDRGAVSSACQCCIVPQHLPYERKALVVVVVEQMHVDVVVVVVCGECSASDV